MKKYQYNTYHVLLYKCKENQLKKILKKKGVKQQYIINSIHLQPAAKYLRYKKR